MFLGNTIASVDPSSRSCVGRADVVFGYRQTQRPEKVLDGVGWGGGANTS
jgi:hypothetical protein